MESECLDLQSLKIRKKVLSTGDCGRVLRLLIGVCCMIPSVVKSMATLHMPADIMDEFASNTGLATDLSAPRRYLWTDAFAVCNFLELHKQSGEQKYLDIALKLVNQVHQVLGKHRPDESVQGWLSGLGEDEGHKHPTIGGLRIGKKLPERKPSEAYDDRLEWDRDGQYYHYVTKWMHALICLGTQLKEPKYITWAAELAKTAHAKFTYSAGSKKRMYWKMSIDLSRAQVPSMGHHDPLDGYITYSVIQALQPDGPNSTSLKDEIADMTVICKGKDWETSDPLGLGGLLVDAFRVMKLVVEQKMAGGDELLETILTASSRGLQSFIARSGFRGSAEYRLAFRELGLAIGFHAVTQMQDMLKDYPELASRRPKIASTLDALNKDGDRVQTEIIAFWSNPGHRAASTWVSHLDINMVMWATSLIPGGFLH